MKLVPGKRTSRLRRWRGGHNASNDWCDQCGWRSIGSIAAGITSGLAALGGTVGGGMAAGTAIAIGAPAAAAVGAGYLTYKAMQNNDQICEGLLDTRERAAEIVTAATNRAAEVGAPIAQHIATQTADTIAQEQRRLKTSLTSMDRWWRTP